METKVKQPVYMAIRENKGSWSEQPQTYLGMVVWDEAVKLAKQQTYPTRLSNTTGFNNQGFYLHPDKQEA